MYCFNHRKKRNTVKESIIIGEQMLLVPWKLPFLLVYGRAQRGQIVPSTKIGATKAWNLDSYMDGQYTPQQNQSHGGSVHIQKQCSMKILKKIIFFI
jgi:hypothetical protein